MSSMYLAGVHTQWGRERHSVSALWWMLVAFTLPPWSFSYSQHLTFPGGPLFLCHMESCCDSQGTFPHERREWQAA